MISTAPIGCVTAPDQAAATEQMPAAPPRAAGGQAAGRAVARRRDRAGEAPRRDRGRHRPVEQRADAKDPRAIEVLAWCTLNGIGMKPDPLAAFWLYREAAALGVVNAAKNQVAIFETRLTSAERQQVLLKENAR